MNVLRVDFARHDEPEDQAAVVRRLMVWCRRTKGLSTDRWARLLSGKVKYGRVTPAAVECYELGQNVPGTDYSFAAMTAAGIPMQRLAELVMDPLIGHLVRRLLILIATHL